MTTEFKIDSGKKVVGLIYLLYAIYGLNGQTHKVAWKIFKYYLFDLSSSFYLKWKKSLKRCFKNVLNHFLIEIYAEA